MKRWLWVTLPIVLILFFSAGWKTVEPGEVVVVRRFGRAMAEPWGPGAHWAWPFGIDRLSRLRLDEVRRLEFGRGDPAGPLDAPGSGEVITGDQNIVRVHGVVQYRVIDPVAFVLRSDDQIGLLTRMIEASLASSLSSRPIDAILREGRAGVARDLGATLTRAVDSLGLGIAVLGVNLTEARPPIEVEPAFAEAQSALSERDQRIIEAKALAGQLRPAALATAEALTSEASTRSHRKIAVANAEASRFLALLLEVDRSPSLTARRLYRDALRDLLPKVRRKVLLTPDEPVDLGIISR